jgi:hypothetical protein
MATIPKAVLSERFGEHLEARRVKTAVFFTFAFDPAFFELQILPAFLDLPLSQVMKIRRVQLEDELRSLDHVAVYYDPRQLLASTEAPRLDIRRIPVSLRSGYFHPKNVFVITESTDHRPGVEPERHLLVAALSANLTEAGWWRNVECCHIEEFTQGATIGFRDDLLELFRATRAACSEFVPHEGLDAIRRFVVGCDQRANRTSDDHLHTRLFGGRESFVDFISEAAFGRLSGLNLEVIAPYLDEAEAAPLKALIKEFQPKEIRVFLPRAKDGNAECSGEYYETVKKLPNVSWAALPKSMLQAGSTERAADRFVHAKVYRFFHPSKRYEALVVGSLNLTAAAHSRGGNLESAFLVETEPNQVPEWWLRLDGKRPATFMEDQNVEDRVATLSACVWLSITFDWNSDKAEVDWRSDEESPEFELLAGGVPLTRLKALPPQSHHQLGNEEALAIKRGLDTTALFTARATGQPDGAVLVREEGMAWKPSIPLTLSVADILRYWTLLTREQRLALLEDVALRDATLVAGLGLGGKGHYQYPRDSFFDNFAQVFQAFANVERSVLEALANNREPEAIQRLLGAKYDSLPCLLDRVLALESEVESVSHYLILLCARQTLAEVKKKHPDFARQNRKRFEDLLQRTGTDKLRRTLNLHSLENPEEFLNWFEHWFVLRAEPAAKEPT